MIEITKENIAEICQKLNDMEYDESTDKEICGWFINQINNFTNDVEKYEDDGYDYFDISISYFGAIPYEVDIIDICEFEIVNDRIKLSYAYKQYGAKINGLIFIPLEYIFNYDIFKKTWEREMVINKVKRLNHEVDVHQHEIIQLQKEIDKEHRKISFVS